MIARGNLAHYADDKRQLAVVQYSCKNGGEDVFTGRSIVSGFKVVTHESLPGAVTPRQRTSCAGVCSRVLFLSSSATMADSGKKRSGPPGGDGGPRKKKGHYLASSSVSWAVALLLLPPPLLLLLLSSHRVFVTT